VVAGKRSHPHLTMSVLAIAGLAYAILSSAVVPALPTIQHDLHTSETGVAWVLTGYLLSASVSTALLGRLGDMFGKQHVLVWTLVAFGGGTLLAAVSHSLGLLIVARLIQGVGGGIFPLSFGIIRDEFPAHEVAGGIGLISAILGIGAGIGIVLGGLVVEHLGWQWLFWLPLAVIVPAALCAWRFIPESPVKIPGRVNWLAAALMSGGISAVLLSVSETTTWGWGSPKTLGLLALGLVVCAIWVVVEAHSDHPLIDMNMMRIRGSGRRT
jgi:MFS family permease